MGVVAAAAVSGGVSAWAVAEAGRGAQVEYVEREVERTPALGAHFAAYEAGQYPDLTYAAENAVKAVVNIEAIQQVEVPRRGQFGYDPFLEFSGSRRSVRAAMASPSIASSVRAVRASSFRPTAMW